MASTPSTKEPDAGFAAVAYPNTSTAKEIDSTALTGGQPQLVMQAFLQRIINGGGRISWEYGLGRKRTDLFEWPLDEELGFNGPMQRIVIGLKIQHQSRDATIAKGLEQTLGYATRAGADYDNLVVFNHDDTVSWDEKIWQDSRVVDGWRIGV